MKALITGPRTYLHEEGTTDLPWMNLEINYKELPKVGETVILNGGTPYIIKRIMWWVLAPMNKAYFARGDYKETAEHEIVHINVEPADGHTELDIYAEGRAKGRKEAAADLAGLLVIGELLDGDNLRSLLGEWIKKEIEATE